MIDIIIALCVFGFCYHYYKQIDKRLEAIEKDMKLHNKRAKWRI